MGAVVFAIFFIPLLLIGRCIVEIIIYHQEKEEKRQREQNIQKNLWAERKAAREERIKSYSKVEGIK